VTDRDGRFSKIIQITRIGDFSIFCCHTCHLSLKKTLCVATTLLSPKFDWHVLRFRSTI
jgi:hypothetical protein